MAGKQGHLVDRLSDRIASEVERVSDDLAGKVNAELLDDQHELPRAQFLERWRASWNDPQWRLQQYQRMGPEGFYDATMDAFGAPKPAPLGRLARDGMTTMAKQGVAAAQAPSLAPDGTASTPGGAAPEGAAAAPPAAAPGPPAGY